MSGSISGSKRVAATRDASAAKQRNLRGLSLILTLGLAGVASAWGCSQAPPPAEEPAAAPALTPSTYELTYDATHVNVRGFVPDDEDGKLEVAFVLSNGAHYSATSDEEGRVHFEPSQEDVFASAQVLEAELTINGRTWSVDTHELQELWQAQYPEAWKAANDRRLAELGAADKGLTFTGRIFRDKNIFPLVETCKPTGDELCFDGIDNDCDGRYDDVGCGYSSGALQWTLSWGGNADLDLHVDGPGGEEVIGSAAGADTILVRDRHCEGLRGNVRDCPAGNIENVHVPVGRSPISGTYITRVEVNNPRGTKDPIHARLSGRIGENTWTMEVELAPIIGNTYHLVYPIGADADRDSVLDEHDACPEEPGCWFDDLRYRGCADRDGDSIPDSIDDCPGKTGLTQLEPGKLGCPLVFGDAWVTNQGIQIQRPVEFNTGKSTLRGDSQKLIRDIARAISEQPASVTKMSIDGHTDEVGDSRQNMELSKRRAAAVRDALLKAGVPREILRARGYGETKPLVEGQNKEAYQANRRVEFVVLRPPPRSAECW